MNLSEYLTGEIAACERRIRSVDLQLTTDSSYLRSPDADPGDVDYVKCQVELYRIEAKYLQRRLTILRKWFAKTGRA